MGKVLQLTRHELVWQTRCNSWSAEEYAQYLDWLKGCKDGESTWAKNNYAIYEVLQNYTWEEILDIIEKCDYDNEPKIQYIGDDGEIWYTTRISEVIKDAIREDNYECDVCDEEYADDYDEDWNVSPDGDKD